jgi:hypothetical protein
MTRSLLLLLLLELLAAPVAAQTVRADRVTLNTGPCVITSGSAAPNGSRVGNVCDTFIQTTSGAIWTKTSGTGTSSGWLATLAGTGTPGTLPVWTSAGAIGDSIIAQAGGVATITGSATITGTGTMNAASITNNASVGGTATIGTEHVTGSSTIDAALAVGGTSTLTGNTTLGGWIGTANYASQVAGWRITSTGAADVRYLFTDELRAKLFTADAESVLAGSERITKSYSTLSVAFTCPAPGVATDLWVFDASTYGDAPVFQDGDAVLIHVLTRTAFGPFTIADCVGTVSQYSDGSGPQAGMQHWAFARGTGANGGAMSTGAVVAVNQLVQDLGVSGNGYVEISALDGPNGSNAPYIQTNTWTTAPIGANTVTRCRLGNLNGLAGAGPEYGILCTSPNSGTLRLSNIAAQFHNIPVDLYDGATQVFRADPAGPTGPYLAMGNPMPTAYAGSNAGVWIGKDADNAYKIRIGNPTGNRLTYANGTLSIVGEGSGITNINGGNIQAGTITAAQVSVTGNPGGAAINPNPNMSDIAFWPVVPGYTAPVMASITDGMVGTTALRSPTGAGNVVVAQGAYPIDPNKTYRGHLWARQTATANGSLFFRFVSKNGAGTDITNFPIVPDGPVPTTWTEYHALITPAMFPAGMRSGAIYLYLNWGGSAGYMEVQDVRLEEATPTTLITPGAVTTNTIAAKTITAANIAANTITVGELNASGFGGNLILNSTFEGATSSVALAGWKIDPSQAGGGTLTTTLGGQNGPNAALLTANGAGYGMIADYLAVPVAPGATYRVALYAYGAQATGGLVVRLLEYTGGAQPRYVVSGAGGVPAGDIAATSTTDVCANCVFGGAWAHPEYIYTVPAGVAWVSLSIWNYACVGGFGTVCQPLYLDGVEMQQQIGQGSIRANSLTANVIAAGTITGDRIAGSTITGSNIAGNTITGALIAGRTITAGNLVANTITSNEIGVRAIVAGNIATGTLTANEIAGGTITGDRIAGGTIVGGNIAGNTISAFNIQAGTITADKLNVTSLSAISANLGTVNAGTITGVTINGTTINGSTFTGGQININSGAFQVDSSGNVTSTGSANFNGTMNVHSLNAGYNAGGVSTVNFNGDVYVAAGMGLTVNVLSGSGNRLVCANNNGRLYLSAANGSC